VPTALPQTGFELPQNAGLVAGALFLVAAAGVFMYTRANTYTTGATEHGTTHHHKKSHHKKTESK
jgi:LPXTG-motif cell wall-anchored protein